MKLIPHCRRVKIRIESGGYSCASLEALKQHFYIEDIIPLVRDGRLQRWLEDLCEDELVLKVSKLSTEATDENKKQTAQKLLHAFLPQYFYGDETDILPYVMMMAETYDHDALFQIVNIFKEDMSKDVILNFWDELVKQYSFEEFHKIVSVYKNIDKEIAYKWACLYQEKMNITYSDAMEVAAKLGHDKAIGLKILLFESDCFKWRDYVKADDHLPTTYKELEALFTETIPNGRQFCKFKPLESFYIDVWHIYNILKASGYISKIIYDEMMKFFDGENLHGNPLCIEREFIFKLLVWHKYDISYPYDKIPYRKSESLLKENARPVKSKGNIDFHEEETDFRFWSLWHQILYIAVNIFNKTLYPGWK